jgi:hypothetical protein
MARFTYAHEGRETIRKDAERAAAAEIAEALDAEEGADLTLWASVVYCEACEDFHVEYPATVN